MEEILLAFEAGAQDEDDVNGLFRAAHTIKGSAGLFGLDEVVASPMSSKACSTACATASIEVPAANCWACCSSAATTSARWSPPPQATSRPIRRRWPAATPCSSACRRSAPPPRPRWRRERRPSRRPRWRSPAEARSAPTLAPFAALRRRRAAHGHGSAGVHPLPDDARRHRALETLCDALPAAETATRRPATSASRSTSGAPPAGRRSRRCSSSCRTIAQIRILPPQPGRRSTSR
jgi:hypothetical protein